MNLCHRCQSASQVWRNQRTGLLTCHRVGCDHAPVEIDRDRYADELAEQRAAEREREREWGERENVKGPNH